MSETKRDSQVDLTSVKDAEERLGTSKEGREVSEVINQYKVVFIHGILPDSSGTVGSPISDQSLLTKDVDWQTRLKIVLSLHPAISTSTIQEGDSESRMWSRMGVVLNGGVVIDASPTDAGSIARALNEKTFAPQRSGDDIDERVRRAIYERKGRYNELIIKLPEVAGFYISLGAEDVVPAEDIFKTTSALGLPVYVIQKGYIYDAMYDPQLKKFIPQNKPITPEELLQRKWSLPDAKRQEITQEVLENSPFRTESSEMQWVDSRDNGRQIYTEINASEILDKFSDTVATLEARETIVSYIVENGKLFRLVKDKRTQNTKKYPIKNFEEHRNGFIFFGSRSFDLKKNLQSTEIYLSAMERAINKIKNEREDFKSGGGDPKQKSYDKVLGCLAFHLYGFGEQAEELGDQNTKIRAFELANSVIPTDQYNKIIEKRVGPNGNFRVTMEDLV